MTLRTLIDEASNLGATIGLDAEVKCWFVGKPEEINPLAILQTSGLAAGWDMNTRKAIAELRIKP